MREDDEGSKRQMEMRECTSEDIAGRSEETKLHPLVPTA